MSCAVITHCAATVCIHDPTLLVNCADHNLRKSGWRNGDHPPATDPDAPAVGWLWTRSVTAAERAVRFMVASIDGRQGAFCSVT
jgi:hypothetical protein